MKECITLKTMNEIKIISNPIRLKVLRNYYAYGKPATVKQMAVYMGEVPANIHYHVKKLVEIKILELHHTENVNGITAKFYIPTAKSIKIDDENNTIEGGYINEKEIIVSNVFDESKTEFLKSMRISSEDEKGTIVASKVRLTKKEYQEVIDFISKLAAKKDGDDQEYLFFSGIIETADE